MQSGGSFGSENVQQQWTNIVSCVQSAHFNNPDSVEFNAALIRLTRLIHEVQGERGVLRNGLVHGSRNVRPEDIRNFVDQVERGSRSIEDTLRDPAIVNMTQLGQRQARFQNADSAANVVPSNARPTDIGGLDSSPDACKARNNDYLSKLISRAQQFQKTADGNPSMIQDAKINIVGCAGETLRQINLLDQGDQRSMRIDNIVQCDRQLNMTLEQFLSPQSGGRNAIYHDNQAGYMQRVRETVDKNMGVISTFDSRDLSMRASTYQSSALSASNVDPASTAYLDRKRAQQMTARQAGRPITPKQPQMSDVYRQQLAAQQERYRHQQQQERQPQKAERSRHSDLSDDSDAPPMKQPRRDTELPVRQGSNTRRPQHDPQNAQTSNRSSSATPKLP